MGVWLSTIMCKADMGARLFILRTMCIFMSFSHSSVEHQQPLMKRCMKSMQKQAV